MHGKSKPVIAANASAAADAVIRDLGGHIVMGLPLGLGKANIIANAIYEKAAADPSISLTILTALTLELPRGASDLHERFLAPLRERLYAGVPEPAYAAALRAGSLPPNIQVHEFFLAAGRWLSIPRAQQDYICANYANAAEVLLSRGMNVIAQMVSRDGEKISLSCNADLTPDLLAARRLGKAEFLFVGEVNPNLPFMSGDAEQPLRECDILLECRETDYSLFSIPKTRVSDADYAAGFQISRLVPDGGTLQIGIGSIGDAVSHALIARHTANTEYRSVCARLSVAPQPPIETHDGPFKIGLFGLSEMLVDSFLPLIDAGVVKREVDNALIHAAFFLGSKEFYKRLIEMDALRRAKISMRPVTWVNTAYGDEDKKREQRRGTRFINNAMMATLMGAVISDGLEDGRIVSGVGGQNDFIEQAFALDGARSIIALNATRPAKGGVRSNIVWSYAHQTIPRQLRDIVVTEYGVADLRGKSDAETIGAMIAISDSRFQAELTEAAKSAGKLPKNFIVPPASRDNTPDRIAAALMTARKAGLAPDYPFGTDFTAEERKLLPALDSLKNLSASPLKLASGFVRGVLLPDGAYKDELQRLQLTHPKSPKGLIMRALVKSALSIGAR